MARIARVIAPGYSHHVTQRGNRRQQTFFCDDDCLAYIELMAEWCCACNVAISAWCLMPNDMLTHVAPLLEKVPNWQEFLQLSSPDEVDMLHRHERTDRPLGDQDFVDQLETSLSRKLRPKKPGPKGKSGEDVIG